MMEQSIKNIEFCFQNQCFIMVNINALMVYQKATHKNDGHFYDIIFHTVLNFPFLDLI